MARGDASAAGVHPEHEALREDGGDESIRDGGMGQLGRGMQLTAIATTGLLYVIGALAMLIYAVRLRLYSTP